MVKGKIYYDKVKDNFFIELPLYLPQQLLEGPLNNINDINKYVKLLKESYFINSKLMYVSIHYNRNIIKRIKSIKLPICLFELRDEFDLHNFDIDVISEVDVNITTVRLNKKSLLKTKSKEQLRLHLTACNELCKFI